MAVRVALAPTVLTIGERAAIEELVHDLALVAGDDSVLIASTRTIEAALFLRPLFELQI